MEEDCTLDKTLLYIYSGADNYPEVGDPRNATTRRKRRTTIEEDTGKGNGLSGGGIFNRNCTVGKLRLNSEHEQTHTISKRSQRVWVDAEVMPGFESSVAFGHL